MERAHHVLLLRVRGVQEQHEHLILIRSVPQLVLVGDRLDARAAESASAGVISSLLVRVSSRRHRLNGKVAEGVDGALAHVLDRSALVVAGAMRSEHWEEPDG